MILITDSNLVVSALISPKGVVANILKDRKSALQFTAPGYLFEEVKKHWSKIEELSELSKKELREELSFYKNKITIYKLENIRKKNLLKAEKVVKEIEPEDVFFVALHFETGHKIWTGDKELQKGLEEKGYHIFVTTQELKAKLYKK